MAAGSCFPQLLLLLFTLSGMDAEDPVLDVGGAFPGIAVAAFNPEEALLLVVGAADIDVIRNTESG